MIAASHPWQDTQLWDYWDPTNTSSAYEDNFFDTDPDLLVYDPDSLDEAQARLQHDLHPESLNDTIDPDQDTMYSSAQDGLLALIPDRFRKRVLRALTQYWYGSQSETVKAYTAHHITTKLTPENFDRVCQFPKNIQVLQEITSDLKKKYGEDFTPTQIQFDLDGNVIPRDNPDVLYAREFNPKWYTEASRKDKANVITKMSQLWYGDTKRKSKALARYLIMKSFTSRDFQYILDSECSLDDPFTVELMKRAVGSKGKAYQNLNLNTRNEMNQMDKEEDSAVNEYDRMESPSWYRHLRYDLKAYVITRMCFLWYKEIENLALRRKAQAKIVSRFTEDDFYTAADPNTPHEIMMEIAERTRGKEIGPRDLKIRAMKKKLCEYGVIKSKSADKYVRDMIAIPGNEAMPVDELENRIVEKRTGYPTLQAWLDFRSNQLQ